jgi:hypothetical protein
MAVEALLSWLYTDALQSTPRNFNAARREERNQAMRTQFAHGENTIDVAQALGSVAGACTKSSTHSENSLSDLLSG